MPEYTFGDRQTAFSLIRFVSFDNIMNKNRRSKKLNIITEFRNHQACRLFLDDQVSMSNTEVFEGIDDTILML